MTPWRGESWASRNGTATTLQGLTSPGPKQLHVVFSANLDRTVQTSRATFCLLLVHAADESVGISSTDGSRAPGLR